MEKPWAAEVSAFYCDVGSTQVWAPTHWPGSWITIALPTPGGSELADHKAVFTALLVVPLAVGVELHTTLCPIIVVGLPWGPV